MSERKVLNKYFPPDFDPSKIPRRKMGGDRQQVVRLMAPFSMRCNTCGEYIYKGKKFNARKETAQNEEYFGIRIFRFYIKCPQCSGEITFKTDPKNTDYIAEHGAMRNFEPWRDDGATAETAEERLERLAAEAEEDPMAELEKKTVDQKREMDILDKLQEVRQRNARLERADVDRALTSVSSRVGVAGVDFEEDADELAARAAAEEDEAEVRKHFGRLPPSIELDESIDPAAPMPEGDEASAAANDESPQPRPAMAGPSVKRKLDDAEPDALAVLSASAKAMAGSVDFAPAKPAASAPGASGSAGPPRKKKVGGSLLPGIKPKGR